MRPIMVRALFVLVFCSAVSLGESTSVGVQFKVDGKLTRAPRSLQCRSASGNLIADVRISGNKFAPPPEALRDSVNVVVRFQGQTLVFEGIHPQKFRADWTVGIEKPPFKEYGYLVTRQPYPVAEVWFIEFLPKDGDGTSLTVFVPVRQK